MNTRALALGSIGWLLIVALGQNTLYTALFSSDADGYVEWFSANLVAVDAAITALRLVGWVGLIAACVWIRRAVPTRGIALAIAGWSISVAILVVWRGLSLVELDVGGAVFQSVNLLWNLAFYGAAIGAVWHAATVGASTWVVRLATAAVLFCVAFTMWNLVDIGTLPWSVSTMLTFLQTVAYYGALLMLPWAAEVADADEDLWAERIERPDPTMDFVVGGAFFFVGAGVTLWSLQAGGTRYVLAWGPMLYGMFRIGRGLIRLG